MAWPGIAPHVIDTHRISKTLHNMVQGCHECGGRGRVHIGTNRLVLLEFGTNRWTTRSPTARPAFISAQLAYTSGNVLCTFPLADSCPHIILQYRQNLKDRLPSHSESQLLVATIVGLVCKVSTASIHVPLVYNEGFSVVNALRWLSSTHMDGCTFRYQRCQARPLVPWRVALEHSSDLKT